MSFQIIATISTGELMINDQNDNGLRDSSDKVAFKHAGSNKLDRSPASVQAALRELYLDTIPVGTRLNPLATFCQTIQKAKIQAANGDIEGLLGSLKFADNQASKVGIYFDYSTVKSELTQIANPIAYQNKVNMALTAAREGLSMSVSAHLYSAAIGFAHTAKIDDETVRADLDRVYLVLAEAIKNKSK